MVAATLLATILLHIHDDFCIKIMITHTRQEYLYVRFFATVLASRKRRYLPIGTAAPSGSVTLPVARLLAYRNSDRQRPALDNANARGQPAVAIYPAYTGKTTLLQRPSPHPRSRLSAPAPETLTASPMSPSSTTLCRDTTPRCARPRSTRDCSVVEGDPTDSQGPSMHRTCPKRATTRSPFVGVSSWADLS